MSCLKVTQAVSGLVQKFFHPAGRINEDPSTLVSHIKCRVIRKVESGSQQSLPANILLAVDLKLANDAVHKGRSSLNFVSRATLALWSGLKIYQFSRDQDAFSGLAQGVEQCEDLRSYVLNG